MGVRTRYNRAMTLPRVDNQALVLDLLEWVGARPRPYAAVMEAWRTSCPRLPIWEDAVDHGFVVCRRRDGEGTIVEVTDAGRAFLAAHRVATAAV
jgi:hypothetical protein